MVSRARRAIQAGDPEAAEAAVRLAEAAVDHAAVKGVIHKNSAARSKSRLWQQLNKLRARVSAG